MAKKKDKTLLLLNNSLERISRQQDYFKTFSNIWDWIYRESEEKVNRELQHLEYIKNVVIRKYWKEEIFVSSAALDDIIFSCVQSFSKSDILNEIDRAVRANGLTHNSVVIFPLTNFGFKYGGLQKLFGVQSLSYRYGNFEVYAQTNSFNTTKKNVEAYINRIKLPYVSKLDKSLFNHYYKSRNLKWFENNPILLLHFKFSQQERYDNIRFIIEKLGFVTTKLYFLTVLSNREDRVGDLLSTANTNNFETNDIYHFLTITTSHKHSTLNCIPVHFDQIELHELMNMNIDLLTKTKSFSHWERNAVDAVEIIYNGYMSYLIDKLDSNAKFYKLANSLNYFKRSLKSRRMEDKIINLNIALECLLLDERRVPKKDTIVARVWKSLKGKINKKENLRTLENIISERNRIVHAGLPATPGVKIQDVNKTYCRLILFLTNNIESIDSTTNEYISVFYDSL